MPFTHVRYLLALLVTAGVVIGAHGLQLTYVGVRGSHEGFGVTTIGVLSAVYSFGFALGCLFVSRVFARFSQRQTFTILTMVAASVTALTAVTSEPNVWVVLRFLSGFAYAGLLAVVESCINANVDNATRGRALSLYRLINLASVAAAQLAIPSVGVDSPALLLMVAAALLFSLVPFAFVTTALKMTPAGSRLNLVKAWRVSPLAVFGAVVSGLTVTTFRSTGPVYAHSIGLTPAGIATFMSAGILGGLILQYPLGFLSDRRSRVGVIVFAMLGAIATEVFLGFFAGIDQLTTTTGILAFGAFSFPLYALSAAHANDRVGNGEDYVPLASSLLFFTSVGGTLGPLIVSGMMDQEGHAAFFHYMIAVHGLMGAYALYHLYSARWAGTVAD